MITKAIGEQQTSMKDPYVNIEFRAPKAQHTLGKFEDPSWTATGENRAEVSLQSLETLWINTGTLCNIACVNCYIESSPSNDIQQRWLQLCRSCLPAWKPVCDFALGF